MKRFKRYLKFLSLIFIIFMLTMSVFAVSGCVTVHAGERRPFEVLLQDVSAGLSHSLAIDIDGNIWAWGSNTALEGMNSSRTMGKLGNNSRDTFFAPVQITWDTQFVSVAAGIRHSVALDSEGFIWIWGRIYVSQNGRTVRYSQMVPKKLNTEQRFQFVSAGSATLAIAVDGSLWAWGNNDVGQLGDDTTVNRHTPTHILQGLYFQAISISSSSNLALDIHGNLWSWGYNFNGSLGDGTSINRPMPVRLLPQTRFSAISSQGTRFAWDIEGNLYAWGTNSNGQLGNGTIGGISLPVRINTLARFTYLSATTVRTIAIDSDGTLWAWGLNHGHSLGNGDSYLGVNNARNRHPNPIQISRVRFKTISVGLGYNLAIDVTGRLWSWGLNLNGVLGNGANDVHFSVPTRV